MANKVSADPEKAMDNFYTQVDTALEQRDLSGHEFIPLQIWAMSVQIATKVTELFKEFESPTLEQINEVLAEVKNDLKLRGEDEAKQGYYAVLHKMPSVEDGQKQGLLVFTVIPKGHQAPRHWHVSGNTDLPGEVTVSLVGELAWQEENDGEIYTTAVDDEVRISKAGSMDNYLVQNTSWVGLYLQFVPCVFKNPNDRSLIMSKVFNDCLAARDLALRGMGLEVTEEEMEKVRINYSIEEFRAPIIETANAVLDEFFAKTPDFEFGSFDDETRSQIINELDIEFGKIIAKVQPKLHNSQNPRRASLILAQRFVDAVIEKHL